MFHNPFSSSIPNSLRSNCYLACWKVSTLKGGASIDCVALLDFDQIDEERMTSICNRLNKPVTRLADLSEAELYVAWHISNKSVYMFKPNIGPQKKTSDLFEHSNKSVTAQTYAEYYREKLPDVQIHPDSPMGTMKAVRHSRTNYLQASTDGKAKTKVSSNVIVDKPVYYPIELLHHAPADQADSKLFSMLPSILVRLTQLHRIEKLRQRLQMEQYTVRESTPLDVTSDLFLVHGSRGHA